MSLKYWVILMFFIICSGAGNPNKPKKGFSNAAEFCGDGIHKTKLHSLMCSDAYIFSPRYRPVCICPKDRYIIHRTYYDDCSSTDGFSCFPPRDKKPNQNEEDAKSLFFKFLQIPPGMAVIGELQSSNNSFSLLRWNADNSTPQKSTLSGNIMYVVRGIVAIEANTYCIEPTAQETDTFVCSYILTEMANVIMQREGCVRGVVLNPTECFDPTNTNDNCDLPCKKVVPETTETPEPGCNSVQINQEYDHSYADRQLMDFNIQRQIGKTRIHGNVKSNRTYTIFRKLVNIFAAYCPDTYISHSWVNMVSELFLNLHTDDSLQYVETIQEKEYRAISRTLDACLRVIVPVQLTNEPKNVGKNICTDKSLAGSAYGYCRDDQCLDVERVVPSTGKTLKQVAKRHSVPEVSFDLLSITQPLCIDQFQKTGYGNFHLLQQTIEKLYTRRIKHLWENPAYLSKPEVKRKLLGPSSELRLHNLEICVGSAFKQKNLENKRKLGPFATQIARLVRPQTENYLKRKRRSTGRTFADVLCLENGEEVKHLPIFCRTSCSDKSVFICKDGRCIPEILACDHQIHCRDKTDEDPSTCKQRCETGGGWWCAADQTCLKQEHRCNAKSECSDHSDESLCYEFCSSREVEFTKDPLGSFYAHNEPVHTEATYGPIPSYCDNKKYVVGSEIWITSDTKDKSGISCLHLLCSQDPSQDGFSNLANKHGPGTKTSFVFSRGQVAVGVKAQFESIQNGIDNRALVNLVFLSSSLEFMRRSCNGVAPVVENTNTYTDSQLGWKEIRMCPPHQYICGFQTQVHGTLGVPVVGDNTGTNNVYFICCRV